MTYEIKVVTERSVSRHVKEVITKTYKIPEKIYCPKCKQQMTYDLMRNGYVCGGKNCDNFVTAREFIKDDLAATRKNKTSKFLSEI